MKRVLEIIKENIIGLIIGLAIALTISATAVTMYASSDVSYDNSNSGASATTVKDALDELYTKVPEYYNPYFIGNTVYYNPVDGAKCFDYVAENSLNNNKTGCMKWYIIKEGTDTIDMILDHNTTARAYWNNSGSNESGPGTTSSGGTYENLLYQLSSDTSGWTGVPARTDTYTDPLKGYEINYSGYRARLIEANEIAKITGADKALQWDSAISSTWFYLDGKYGTDSTWHTQVAASQGASKYAWLFDYTSSCTSKGCNIADSSGYYGYWTSSASAYNSSSAWRVYFYGYLLDGSVRNSDFGVRPVITISKS